jgi:hypothetical protein
MNIDGTLCGSQLLMRNCASGARTTWGCGFSISRQLLPEVCKSFTRPSSEGACDPQERAQGRPGARRTRGLVCGCAQEIAHEHTGEAEASGLPCAMALRFTRALPGERLCRRVFTFARAHREEHRITSATDNADQIARGCERVDKNPSFPFRSRLFGKRPFHNQAPAVR